jgi:hypothetical protein
MLLRKRSGCGEGNIAKSITGRDPSTRQSCIDHLPSSGIDHGDRRGFHAALG